jgi:hypothetical protein
MAPLLLLLLCGAAPDDGFVSLAGDWAFTVVGEDDAGDDARDEAFFVGADADVAGWEHMTVPGRFIDFGHPHLAGVVWM